MTTSQLIVLCYAALLIVTVLLVGALDSLGASATPKLIGAIVVLAAVLIYTLKPHSLARRRFVALAVLLPPILAGGAGYGWSLYSERQAEHAARIEREILAREALDDRTLAHEIREAVRTKRHERGTVVIDVPKIGLMQFPAAMPDAALIRAIEAQVAPIADAESIRKRWLRR